MFLKREKKREHNLNHIVELTPCEADTIIASGVSALMPEQVQAYDFGRNRQMQSLLNKLHGK
ncbi:MAG: hypothetical protein IIT46_14145 [Lachnospiraceae bacterium]|nr:hypothetical protein [Lachnospiraceae bacterium]MBQ5560897.1 hypothetical protein [Lachnospiraceae bacterium]